MMSRRRLLSPSHPFYHYLSLTYTSNTRLYSTRPAHPLSTEPLTASVPHHDAYLFLHTNRPPTSWPARIEAASPLLRTLKQGMRKWDGLVNFAYIPNSATPASPRDYYAWDDAGPEYYSATLYRSGCHDAITLPSVTVSTDLDALMRSPVQAVDSASPAERQHAVHFYVCTHGSRDCRCGDAGGDVVDALNQEIAKLPDTQRTAYEVREVSHVGGHKWAANVLVFPSGDWFGNLRPNDIPSLLERFGHAPVRDTTPLFLNHWRGRMGLSQNHQQTHYSDVQRGANDSGASSFELKPLPRVAEYSVPFTTWEGDVVKVAAKEGQHLMEVAKAAGLPSIEGTCGGNLECATCHLYIPARATDGVPAPVPPVSEAEEDMLEYAIGLQDSSRLGCQIRVTTELVEWLEKGGAIKLPRF